MFGVDRHGRLILLVADGRRPGYSDGLSLLEGARFLRRLGAVDAINLDGGGSVTLAVHGRLVNRPSDAQGERAVATPSSSSRPGTTSGRARQPSRGGRSGRPGRAGAPLQRGEASASTAAMCPPPSGAGTSRKPCSGS